MSKQAISRKKCLGSGMTFNTRHERGGDTDENGRLICPACYRLLKKLNHPGSRFYVVIPQHNEPRTPHD